MAWSASGIFRSCITDTFAGTSVFNLTGSTYKVALYGTSSTPNKDDTSANNSYGTTWAGGAEISTTGWAAGGIALTSRTVTNPASGIIQFNGANTASSSGTTMSGIYGSLIYDDGKTPKQGVCFNYFGGSAQSVTNGTLTVVWNATNGIFRITV